MTDRHNHIIKKLSLVIQGRAFFHGKKNEFSVVDNITVKFTDVNYGLFYTTYRSKKLHLVAGVNKYRNSHRQGLKTDGDGN